MELRAKRFTATEQNPKLGPAKYNTLQYKPKESFNRASVSFGSNSQLQLFEGSRQTYIANSCSPGPGSYHNPDTIANQQQL
jgi:hypothetical protein